MKKNNKTTVYFLLPAVVIIWGLIFYRIFGGLSDDSTSQFSSKEVLAGAKREVLSVPEFHLNLDYPDPFLGGRSVKKTEPQEAVLTEPLYIQQGPVWPQIDYRGCVSNEKGTTAYLVINGQIRLTGKGTLDDDIEILQIQEDSVLIGLKKEKQWIKKL